MAKRVLALLLAVLLCGCSVDLDAGSLLEPPRLTSEQSAVYDALESAVGSSSFRFKYPRGGSHPAACTLYDLDGDGVQEAVAFYEQTVGNTTSTWLSILSCRDGVWRCVRQIPGEAANIDRLEFVDILGGSKSILVGWSSPISEKCTCTFYFYEDGQVEKYKTDFDYHDLMIGDVDGDGRQEVILCTCGSRVGSMVLLHESGGRIVRTGTADLLPDIASFSQITAGQYAPGLRAVFVDALMSNGTERTLAVPVERSGGRTKFASEDNENYAAFPDVPRPGGQAVCADINGDGLMDVPYCSLLPGYRAEDEDAVWLTTYRSFLEGELTDVGRVVTNTSAGYRFLFPENWGDNITVHSYPVNREWRFMLTAEDEEEEVARELLRIRVLLPSDYQDKFETEQYVTAATRGSYEYQIAVPVQAPEEYAVTVQQAAECLSLLN